MKTRSPCHPARACPPSSRRLGRGFTLIELLVVVAIIALLVSILMPSLSRAKDMAKTAACAMNERAFSPGFTMYASDYEGALPWSYSYYYDRNWYTYQIYGGASWAALIYPYTGDGPYACPANPPENGKPEYGVNNSRNYLRNMQYTANPYLGWSVYGPGGDSNGPYNPLTRNPAINDEDGGFNPVRTDRIKGPIFSRFLAGDKMWPGLAYSDTPYGGRIYWTGGAGDDRTDSSKYNPWYTMPNLGTWHMKKSNFAFMDGHVELVAPKDRRSFGDGTEDLDRFYWKLDYGAR